MAIARVGKRFGVFDIRIGLPRDKGFDPVEASKRINQRANPQTTVNKFRALVSSGEGLARSNKFIAVINFPSGVTADTTFAKNMSLWKLSPMDGTWITQPGETSSHLLIENMLCYMSCCVF